MKKEYTENISAMTIKHKVIICDNPNCQTVIRDKRDSDHCLVCDKPFDVDLEEHWQTGDKEGTGLLDFCSEKCLNKTVPKPPDSKAKKIAKQALNPNG